MDLTSISSNKFMKILKMLFVITNELSAKVNELFDIIKTFNISGFYANYGVLKSLKFTKIIQIL